MTQIATTRVLPWQDITFFPTKTLSQLAVGRPGHALAADGRRVGVADAPLHKISALQDVEQGKRLEVEETLGYAVRQRAALGIPTPTMDVCYKLIAGINHYLQ